MSEEVKKKIRSVIGEVVSNKMDKTIAVKINITKRHPLIKKIIRRSKKIYAHDEQNQCNIGDKVMVVETRALSKMKRYRLKSILERAK